MNLCSNVISLISRSHFDKNMIDCPILVEEYLNNSGHQIPPTCYGNLPIDDEPIEIIVNKFEKLSASSTLFLFNSSKRVV